MQEQPKLSKRYDHILVGYNLSSLTFAFELFKRNQSFCLLDSKLLNGSGAKYISSIEGLVSTRVPFNGPIDPDSLDPAVFGDVTTTETTPLTYNKGEFKSFLGFGETKIDSMEAVEPFVTAAQTQTQRSVENFWQQALESTETFLYLDQQITDIEYDEEGITQITLNGKTALKGSQFYFFDQFPFLFEKLGSEMKKQASQFAKSKWSSSVNLVIHHQEEPESYELNQLYLLMGSKNQPCLGQFSLINGHLVSRWESFFPAELTVDSETTGMALKEIKKQIKRAFFPQAPLKSFEHILLHDRIHSDLSKTGITNGKLTHFNNLYVFSPLFRGSIGWIHEVLCGREAMELVDLAPARATQDSENPENKAAL
jgi:hypothetical protein